LQSTIAIYRRSPHLSLPLQQSRVPSPTVAVYHRRLQYRRNSLTLLSQSTYHRNLMSQYTVSV
jgi:hypothetical protein